MENLTEFINQCIRDVADKFIKDPFKYFAEPDLHFEFQEHFKAKYQNGPYFIHREYPVIVENFEFGKGTRKPNKDARIDIVITNLDDEKKERPLLGIEMYLGKFNDEGLISLGERTYFIPRSSFSDKKILKHLERDYWKLSRITPNRYFLVYFITHVFNTRKRLRRRIERISEITTALQSYPEVSKDRLIIIEAIYENGLPRSRKELNLPELMSNLP